MSEDKRDAEINRLKARVEFLEHGEGVVREAERYKNICDEYQQQVSRLSDNVSTLRANMSEAQEALAGLPESWKKDPLVMKAAEALARGARIKAKG